jgi:predicted transglutaminase-like cysteine proteinase
MLIALPPERIAFQDLGALLARQPSVAKRWQQHLIASPFGTIHAATFSLPSPIGTAIPHPPIYALANFDPADIAGSIDKQPLGDATAPLQFPKANSKAKQDSLITRPRAPLPPLLPLLASAPVPEPKFARKFDVHLPYEFAMHERTPTPNIELPHADSSLAKLTPAVFSTPVLAPAAFVRFCIRYPNDCKVRQTEFDQRPVPLTTARLIELSEINRDVNQSIKPQAKRKSVLAEDWVVAPYEGDCTDYAVTKRHELLARGWPSHSLLLAEVVVASGEHHLVLVVRTSEADLVLDNLNGDVRPVSQIEYRWVRAQQAENPKFWSTINVRRADRVAANSH